MTLHIGDIISQKIEEEGRTKTWLAQQVGRDKSTFCKMLKNNSICACLLMQISLAMNYNFFDDLSTYYAERQQYG